MPCFRAGTTRGASPLEYVPQQGVDVVIVADVRRVLGSFVSVAMPLGSGDDAGAIGPTELMPS